MRVVADTTELFSFFNARSKARELALKPGLELHAPVFALEEIAEKRSKIISSFSLTPQQYRLISLLIGDVVRSYETKEYSEFIPKAKKISPDPEDVDFFALALKLICPVWSEDRQLARQSEVRIIPTNELKSMI